MSETRIETPTTSRKPPRSRKRPVKAEPQTTTEPVSTAQATAVVVSLAAIDRDSMIATAAYFRALKRNFAAGHELEDWLAAESEIDAALHAGNGTS